MSDGPVVGRSPWPDARELAEQLVADSGQSVKAVLLYGSRLQKTNPDKHSALDFMVLVDDYSGFYEGLSASHELHRPRRVMTALANVLPPNVIAYAPDEGTAGIAKCLIVDKRHLARALSADPPDHFLLGRLVQKVGYVWSASDADEAWLRDRIAEAHAGVVEWMAPYLEGPVDAAGLGRRLLEVCYRGEIRPESRSRADRVFEAQEEHFRMALQPALDRAVEEGVMVEADAGYRLRAPVPAAQRRRWRGHFIRSKTRTTLRWFKHIVTFANWLPYVQRKVERHTGRSIQLTTLERRLPIIFLWPRAIHVLLTRPRREVDQ
ncbi:MAG: hypothetical protein HKO77_07555 [Gemmatimonadetes bacterium]|nr:hypothetical protein [Gemmatimonadota bacterium]NNL30862.1 hypothetical protein [Gemmatimonadota bacterium]